LRISPNFSASDGFNSIVVIDEDGVILVGHGRVEAAKLAGLSTLPVLRITHLTAEQKVGFSLADNKIALNSDWDSLGAGERAET
jgi:ParB-like chromosome segregation protein Spo0J